MTQPVKPHLAPVEAPEPEPRSSGPVKKPTGTRTVIWGVVSALLGAVLALGVGIIQDNRRLSPHAPAVTITAVQVYTPEISRPDPNKPEPPTLIDRQVNILRDDLGLTDKDMSIPQASAPDLVAATTAAGVTLQSIQSPLQYIRVDTWVDDIQTAAKAIIGYYTQKVFIDKLQALLGDKSRSFEEAKEGFVQLLEQDPDHDSAFSMLAMAYQTNPDDPAIKQIEARLPGLQAQKAIWPFFVVPGGQLPDELFSIGKLGIALRNDNNIGRAQANQKIAILVSRFDRDDLARVAQLAVTMLLSETDRLGKFLAESDKVVKAQVQPRVVLESAVYNSSRSPVTVSPHAVLRVVAAGGMRFDIVLNLVATDTLQEKDDAVQVPASISSAPTVRYATVESGKLARVRWSGEFKGTAEQWGSLAKAYESGTLNCEFTTRTADGLISRSRAAPFGGIRADVDDGIRKIADEQAN